jgi:copper transport protein
VRRRAAAVAVVACLALALGTQSASAHALLKASDPANGAELASAPSQVLLTFTEDPDPALSIVHVLDSGGNQVEKGKARAVPGHRAQLVIDLPVLGKGVYTVSWRTVSRVDGHTTGGAFAFGVGVSPAGATLPKSAQVKSPSPSVLSVAGKWFFYAGLFLLLGGAAAAIAIFPHDRAVETRLLLAGWIAAAAGLFAFVDAQRSDAGIGFSHVFGTSIGHAFILRVVPLAIVLGGVALARAPQLRTPSLAVILAGTVATIVTHVYEGHAAAGSWGIGKVALQAGHVVVGGLWIGGIVALLLGMRHLEGAARARAVSRFSGAALWLVVLLGLSGIGRAINEIDSWHGLFSTSYGQVVIAKSALLVALIVLGAVNRYRYVPRAGDTTSGLRRVMSSELVLVAAVLALTGILSGVAPARSVAASTPVQTSVVSTGSDFGRTVRLRLSTTPGSGGSNKFELKVSDFASGAPVSATVSLRFHFLGPVDVGTSTLALARASAGTYRAQGTNLSIGGVWTVTALIQRGTASVEVPLTVATRVTQQVVVSAAPGQPTLYTITLAQGRSVQFYVDPGKAGADEVHATFFENGGDFKGLNGYSVVATPPNGQPIGLDNRLLAVGHIVSDAQLTPGAWRFDVWTHTSSGELVWSYFEQTIGR